MRIQDSKSALLAAVVFASAAALASFDFKSGDATLRLSDKGAVESLVAGDAERIVPAAEAFTLQLLDGKGEPTRLKSSDFVFDLGRAASMMPPQSAVSSKPSYLTWRHANGLVVRMKIEAAEGEFRFTPSVEGIPAGTLLEWFDGPQVCISPDRKLFWPDWD